MENPPIVTALPIGEFEAIIQVFNDLEVDLFIAPPVSSEEEARRSITQLSKRNPDIILLIPLGGLSAQTIETPVLTSPRLCLIWTIQGRFALPSSIENNPRSKHYENGCHTWRATSWSN